MAVNKKELHKLIDRMDDPVELHLAFDTIQSIVDGHPGQGDHLYGWQRIEIVRSLKEADEGDFAKPREVKRFTEKWL